MASTQDAHLTCLCGAVREGGDVLKAGTFPLGTDLCHCNPCRYTTGALFLTTGELQRAPSAASLAACTQYASSAKITRHFCATCGSHCFLQHSGAERWTALSGIIEGATQPLHETIKVLYHGYAGDTVDYELSRRLLRIGGEDIPCYAEGDDGPPLGRAELQSIATPPAAPTDALEARCHCGSVAFQLLRPQWHELDVDAKYQPTAAHRDKYIAAFCSCRSCRLANGAASLHPWLYVPPSRLLDRAGQPIRFGNQGTSLDGIVDYQSSEQIIRSFCKKCGATVFYWCESRPEIIDVAVGLLRAPEGSMARSWLWWRPDFVSWAQEQVDLTFTAAIIEATKD